MQVDLLHFVATNVRERDGHAVVGNLPEQHALFVVGLLAGRGSACGSARHLGRGACMGVGGEHVQEKRSGKGGKRNVMRRRKEI